MYDTHNLHIPSHKTKKTQMSLGGYKILGHEELYTTAADCDHKECFSIDCPISSCFEASGRSARFLESKLKPVNCGNSSAIAVPHDRFDLGRCIRLMEHHRNWNIQAVGSFGPVWKRIAENWGTLTSLYHDGFVEKLEAQLQLCHA